MAQSEGNRTNGFRAVLRKLGPRCGRSRGEAGFSRPGRCGSCGFSGVTAGMCLGDGDEEDRVGSGLGSPVVTVGRKGRGPRREVAGRIWREGWHSPSGPGYRPGLLRDQLGCGQVVPHTHRGRAEDQRCFLCLLKFNGHPSQPNTPASHMGQGTPRCDAVLLNHMLNYTYCHTLTCRHVEVPTE